jgi:hypothetical protein
MEDIERPSFENFLSKPTNLTDHLAWQLGALSLRREVREAAEQIIGNLNEDGYLIASDEEMLGIAPPAAPEADAEAAKNIISEAAALGLGQEEALSRDESPNDASPTSVGLPVNDLNDLIGAAANVSGFSSIVPARESILSRVENLPASSPAEISFGSRNGDPRRKPRNFRVPFKDRISRLPICRTRSKSFASSILPA